MKILITGPSGSGKSYIAKTLRERGINAVDADLIKPLWGWFDAQENEVIMPADADEEFFLNHQFLWRREVLEKLLKDTANVYFFGLAENTFEMLNLFDKTYFLHASPAVLERNLKYKNRDNPLGKTEYQVRLALHYAKEIEDKAKILNFQFVNAAQNPEEIFSIINAK